MPLALIWRIPSPSLEAGPGSREEARGRGSQEFKLVVGVGRAGGWEWPAVKAWATGCCAELHWEEGGGSRAGTELLSQMPEGLWGRRQEDGHELGPVKAPQGGGPRGRIGC